MKIISILKAESMFKDLPDNFYTYYWHLTDEDKIIVRRDGLLYLCKDMEEAYIVIDKD